MSELPRYGGAPGRENETGATPAGSISEGTSTATTSRVIGGKVQKTQEPQVATRSPLTVDQIKEMERKCYNGIILATDVMALTSSITFVVAPEAGTKTAAKFIGTAQSIASTAFVWAGVSKGYTTVGDGIVSSVLTISGVFIPVIPSIAQVAYDTYFLTR